MPLVYLGCVGLIVTHPIDTVRVSTCNNNTMVVVTMIQWVNISVPPGNFFK